MTTYRERRTPRPGDSYTKHGKEFCRVIALDCYQRIWVSFFGYGDESRFTIAEFHKMIDRETWGHP